MNEKVSENQCKKPVIMNLLYSSCIVTQETTQHVSLINTYQKLWSEKWSKIEMSESTHYAVVATSVNLKQAVAKSATISRHKYHITQRDNYYTENQLDDTDGN